VPTIVDIFDYIINLRMEIDRLTQINARLDAQVKELNMDKTKES
jgi:hypothetical protein